jgi:hypothetical protein
MNCIKLLLLAFLFSSFSCLASEEKFGIVTSQNGVFCVSFGEKPPPIGSSIKILETQSPQYFFEGKLGSENESCKVLEKADVVGPYFMVKTEKKIANPFVGVAVFSKNTLSVVNNEVVLNSASSKEKIYFRSCTSNEGLHFSSWQGQPLKGEQLWRVYYYLGYDVEPSCQENEFKK